MRFLFVIKEEPKVEPLGIMYLSASLKEYGHEVKVTTADMADKVIGEWEPHYVGYSVMTGDVQQFKFLNSWLSKKYNFIPVFGGPHPTFYPDDFDAETCIVIRGDGEYLLPLILKKKHQSGVFGPDIVNVDDVPHPDRTLFDTPFPHFMASRGCPYNCSYCFNSKWKKVTGQKSVRYRNVDDLIAEIHDVVADFAYFQDDNFGLSMKWMRRFSRLYRGPSYHCHIRPDVMDEERGDLLAASGCRSLHMALETANDELRLKVLGRDVTVAQVERAVKICKDRGIRVMLQNIIGLPGGTIEADLETLKANVRMQPDYAWCSIYQPYPGTVLGDYCVEKGLWTHGKQLPSGFFDQSPLYRGTQYGDELEVLQKEFAYAVKNEYVPTFLTTRHFMKRVYDTERNLADQVLYGKELV